MPRLALAPDAPSLADGVVAAIREATAAGELRAGETYSVYQLADLLGVSRSPVREAVTRMADAGLVEVVRNRGFRLVVPGGEDLVEIFGIRVALEPPAARLAADRPEGHGAVRRAVGEMTDAAARGDETAFWAADRGLHDAILRAAGRRQAAAVVARLRTTTALLGPPTTASGRSLVEILEEHRAVVDALLAGDGAGAEEAMRRHLEETGRRLVAYADRPRPRG